MIYISSSCVKNTKIKDSVEELATNGFKNIELSGGTEYYDNFENDLLKLKDKHPTKPIVPVCLSLNFPLETPIFEGSSFGILYPTCKIA